MKVVIVGAGIAGSILAYVLHHTSGVEVRCLERAPQDDRYDSMTGLNLGPNAVKALAAHVPELHEAVLRVSMLWRSWRVSLADGTPLMALPLSQVAENPGVRVRWSDVHRVLRAAAAPRVSFDTRLVAAGYSALHPGKIFIEARRGSRERIGWEDVDLLVGADGRYSEVRKDLCGLPSIRRFDADLFQVLVPDAGAAPVDDYEEWFDGASRLLAFRVPGDAVFISGSVPRVEGAPRPVLSEGFKARGTPASRAWDWLVEALHAHRERVRWSRLEEVQPLYSDERGHVLLIGEAAHGMVPTLGQGATQAIEDACLAAAQIRAHCLGARRAKLPVDVPKLVRGIAERRAARVRFAMDFSLQASDTLLPGGDPVAGTLRKLQPPFREKLRRLYCEPPVVI